jgi:hypothetical protein
MKHPGRVPTIIAFTPVGIGARSATAQESVLFGDLAAEIPSIPDDVRHSARFPRILCAGDSVLARPKHERSDFEQLAWPPTDAALWLEIPTA